MGGIDDNLQAGQRHSRPAPVLCVHIAGA